MTLKLSSEAKRERELSQGRKRRKRYRLRHPERVKAQARNRHAREDKASAKHILRRVSAKAKMLGIDFDLCAEDIVIPEVCPVLGIALTAPGSGKRCDNTATLDRKDNSEGYAKDNVVIVSWRANRLKADATVDELVKLASFYGGVS